MGKCIKRTKGTIKKWAKSLTPVGIALIGSIAEEIDGLELDNATKRKAALAAIKASFKQARIEAKERAIRGTLEFALEALHEGSAALAELGDASETEIDAEPA